jgi:hypothetical protein
MTKYFTGQGKEVTAEIAGLYEKITILERENTELKRKLAEKPKEAREKVVKIYER